MKNICRFLLVVVMGGAFVGGCGAMERAETVISWMDEIDARVVQERSERTQMELQIERLKLEVERLKSEFAQEKKELLKKIKEQQEIFGSANDELKKKFEVVNEDLTKARQMIQGFEDIKNTLIPEKFREDEDNKYDVETMLRVSIERMIEENARLEKDLQEKTQESLSWEAKYKDLLQEYKKVCAAAKKLRGTVFPKKGILKK